MLRMQWSEGGCADGPGGRITARAAETRGADRRPAGTAGTWTGKGGVALTIVLSCAAACGGASDSLHAGPELVSLERIVLSEVDSGFVGQPWALAVARDGRFLVADGAARRILVFGRDGRFVGGIGRPGSGPGEFAAPTWLALGGDSLVYALDNPRVLAFDQRSGAFRWARSFPRRLSMLAAHGDRLFAGYPDSLGNGSVAVLDGDTSTFRVIGPFPELLRFPPIRMMAGTVAVAVERDELATAYAMTDRVYISRIDGDVLDSIAVPAVRRQGAQTELLRRFAESPWDVEVAERAIYGSSAPLGLHWLPSGMLALVTVDARVEQGRIVGESFLSVIDRGRRRSCVDAPIPGPREPLPRVAFRGDTLFVITQDVTPDDRVVTAIDLYRIATNACRWQAG